MSLGEKYDMIGQYTYSRGHARSIYAHAVLRIHLRRLALLARLLLLFDLARYHVSFICDYQVLNRSDETGNSTRGRFRKFVMCRGSIL